MSPINKCIFLEAELTGGINMNVPPQWVTVNQLQARLPKRNFNTYTSLL
jgi:hypothetical protein